MTNTEKQKNVAPKEIGSTHISQTYDSFYDQGLAELVFPKSIQTYDEMATNVTIASALNIAKIIAGRVPIYWEAYNSTPTHLSRLEFVESCFNDMDIRFSEFLKSAMSFNQYGFSVHEKVFRLRRRKYGSMFDDNKVGIKYLPIRKQNSIVKWDFSDENRELLGLTQRTVGITTKRNIKLKNNKDTYIPRNRFMLFRTDPSTGAPEGVSPLYSAYNAWRELQRLKDLELIAASKNLNGLPVGKMPSEFMSEELDDGEESVYAEFKKGISKVSIGEQSSFILPSDRDELGNPIWNIELLNASSSNITAISAMIDRTKNDLYQSLYADILQSSDTASKDSTAASMLNMMVEDRIKEIFDVINTDLVPELFRRNGWDDTKTPKLKYGKLDNINIPEFAKAIQQLKATKTVVIDPTNINYIAKIMGLPFRVPEDATDDELDRLLRVESKDESRSGDSLDKGNGGSNGTSDKVSEEDNSASNLSNK